MLLNLTLNAVFKIKKFYTYCWSCHSFLFHGTYYKSDYLNRFDKKMFSHWLTVSTLNPQSGKGLLYLVAVSLLHVHCFLLFNFSSLFWGGGFHFVTTHSHWSVKHCGSSNTGRFFQHAVTNKDWIANHKFIVCSCFFTFLKTDWKNKRSTATSQSV